MENRKSIIFSAENLRKNFARKTIFSGISFTLSGCGSLTVAGRNGAGKSTLLKVLAAINSPSAGTVTTTFEGKPVPAGERFQHIGFVAPYLQLYEEFTAWENLDLQRRIRNVECRDGRFDVLLERVQLHQRRHDIVKTYSSGMKQRLKYACALLHGPAILLLDEPTANLDIAGRKLVEEIVAEQRGNGIAIIATNEPQEIGWCEQLIDLDARRGN